MALPLIPVIVVGTGLVTGAGGAILGVKGGYDIKKANKRIRSASVRYEAERAALEARVVATNASLIALGTQQEEAYRAVVDRMAYFLRRHEKLVSQSEKLLVEGMETTTSHVSLDDSLGQDAIAWMRGIAGSTVAGVGINVGLTSAVTALASASTGTAISTLSGAAATNATLAFLGGGSLAAGGGGMAVGAAALNFVTIGPALLVSGFVVAGQGETAKTKAHENEAEVNIAIAEAQATSAKFEAIAARADELARLLDELATRATSSLDRLEAETFDPALHAIPFQQALTMTMATRDVAATPIVDEAGELNAETAFRLRYRALLKEVDDV